LYMQVVEYDEAAYEAFDDWDDEHTFRDDLDAAACSLDGSRYYKDSTAASQLAVDDDTKQKKSKTKGEGAADAAGASSSSGSGRGSGSGDKDGELMVFESLEAANAKAVEVLLQEAKVVPDECELLPDDPAVAAAAAAVAAAAAGAKATKNSSQSNSCQAGAESSAAAVAGGAAAAEAAVAAAEAAGGIMRDAGGGRSSWQYEQVVRVAVWDEIKCIAVSKITVEVVPAQQEDGQ
jgi:hypothetical protein